MKNLLNQIDHKEYDLFSFRDLECIGKVINVVDGDTVDTLLEIPIYKLKNIYLKRRKKSLDFVKSCEFIEGNEQAKMIVKVRCRFFGIDTPKLNTPEGQLSTDFVKETMLDKFFVCKFFGLGVHGRHLTLFFNEDGECINSIMLEQNLGVPYFGGKKE